MYGYVIPNRPELKVREAELYQSVYCGLCHNLSARYGFLTRFLVNYDFTFLAMSLMGRDHCPACQRRCVAHPFRKRKVCAPLPALDTAADETVILAYHKFLDGAADHRGLKRLAYRLLALIYRRAYRRAGKRVPAFAQVVSHNLTRLQALEEERSPEMDRVADTFAGLLAGAAPAEGELERVYHQFFYHLGRWIYLVDALDDLPEDLTLGRYNPIALRYGLKEGKREKVRESLELTLNHSRNLMISAFHLLPQGPCSPIVWNVLTLGMDMVQNAVFAGRWNKRRNKKDKELGPET